MAIRENNLPYEQSINSGDRVRMVDANGNSKQVVVTLLKSFITAEIDADIDSVTGMTVTAHLLAAGSAPTVTKSTVGEVINLDFGIPEGEKGEDGEGITNIVMNPDYTLTITYGDGQSYTTAPVRGATGPAGPTGATPDFSIGTVTTGEPGTDADATITGTAEEPVLNLTIPRGDTGQVVVDSALSGSSENPVQNKVITAEIDRINTWGFSVLNGKLCVTFTE